MKKFPRLIELLRETMNLTLGEAEALTRGGVFQGSCRVTV